MAARSARSRLCSRRSAPSSVRCRFRAPAITPHASAPTATTLAFALITAATQHVRLNSAAGCWYACSIATPISRNRLTLALLRTHPHAPAPRQRAAARHRAALQHITGKHAASWPRLAISATPHCYCASTGSRMKGGWASLQRSGRSRSWPSCRRMSVHDGPDSSGTMAR